MATNATDLSTSTLREKGDKLPICFYVAMGTTFAYLVSVIFLKLKLSKTKSASIGVAPSGKPKPTTETPSGPATLGSQPSVGVAGRTENLQSPHEPTTERLARKGLEAPKVVIIESFDTNQDCAAGGGMNSPTHTPQTLQQSTRTFVVPPKDKSPEKPSYFSQFLSDHSWTKICFAKKPNSPLRALSSLYVTIVGTFLITGILLDLLCRCPDQDWKGCCRGNYRTLALGVAPFPIALFWCLANRFGFDLFLKPRSSEKYRAKRKERAEPDFRMSFVVCVFAMIVIAIAGVVATSVYSFRFNEETSLVWIGMVGICMVVEGVVFDSVYQLLYYALFAPRPQEDKVELDLRRVQQQGLAI